MDGTPVAKGTPIPRFHAPKRGIVLALLLAGLVLGAALVAAFAWPDGERGFVEEGWVSAGSAGKVQENSPVRDAEHGFWLVRLESGEVLALWQRDPHLGCTVPWNPEFEFMEAKGWFRNPCHNETYDLTGRCFSGPCARGLDRFGVRIVNGEVWVNPRHVIEGPPLGPEVCRADPIEQGCPPPEIGVQPVTP